MTGLVVLFFAACAVPPPLVITRARMIEEGRVVADRELIIDGSRVTAAGRSGKLRRPRSARVIDAGGDTLLPGLIDAHAHMYELGGPSPKEMYAAPRENSFPITGRQLLRSGVTTARVHLFDLVHGPALKRQADAACFPAPRLQIGGPGMAGGRPDMSGSYFSGYRDLEDAKTRLRAMRDAGADWIAFHSLDKFPAGDLETIAAEARRVGLRVMAEGDPADRAARALTIGADSIEYLDRSPGAGYSPELISQLAATKTIVVAPVGYYNRVVAMKQRPELVELPWLTEFMPAPVATGVRERLSAWAAKPDSMIEAIDRVNDRFLALTRGSVKIAAGTDCGSPGNFQIDAIWWELETRRKLGIPAAHAVAAATSMGARLLGIDDAGHLRPGARGDFVLVRGDVSNGAFELGRVRTVGKSGVLFVDEGKWIRD